MASFISKQVRFRVYLRDKLTDAGGEWADFGDGGQYDTKDPELIELLVNNPAFNVDYVRVPEDKGIVYVCPQCDYESDKARAVMAHAMKVHKLRCPKDKLIKKKVVVEV